MRKKQSLLILMFVAMFIVGCGSNNSSTEPTETLEPTESTESTEEIALETEETEETEEEHQLFNPDEIGSDRDNFWFEDEATIAYIMNIPGVSDLSDEELDAFMNELAELIYIDEFNGDVEQTESYIVSDLLPKYLEKQTEAKETESKQPSQSSSNTSTSSESQDINNNQVGPDDSLFGSDEGADWGEYTGSSANWQSDSSSTSSNTDNSANYIDESQINNNQVGPEDQYFFQDDPADWGEYTGSSANWQY